MSTINDEITRLKNAKIDLRNSIEAKGVSVDPEFTIDKYSVCVDAITQGANLTTLSATSNTTYRPTSPYDGYSEVTVNVQPNLTTLNATSNQTYTPSSPYVGYSSVTVNVGGSNESYITAYYLNTPNSNFTNFDNTLFYNNTNVTAVYIDGVQQNSLNPTFRPTDWKMHEIKVVFDSNNNSYSEELFTAGLPIVDIDYSHYTGTDFKAINFNRITGKAILSVPATATTLSTNWSDVNYYLNSPATISTLHSNTWAINYKYDVVSPYDEMSGNVLVDKTTKEVVFCAMWGLVDLPAGTTSYMGVGFPNALYVPDTVTDFKMNTESHVYYFKGTTPPTFQSGGYMDYGVICVPSGCVADYKTALDDTGELSYGDYVKEVGVTTVYFTYASGNNSIQISGGFWDGSRIFEVEIYDDQDTMIYSQPYHGGENFFIPVSLLNGYGDYYLKIYYDAELESFLNGAGVCDTVTEIDYSGINKSQLPRYSACGYNNLLKITVPDNVDTLLNSFAANCPELKEVWLDSQTMVNLPEGDYFVVDNPRAQPVKVMVHNKADYENDQAWIDLVGNGVITIDEY